MEFLVLGCGNIGYAIIRDLSRSKIATEIIAVDINPESLRKIEQEFKDVVKCIKADVRNEDLLMNLMRKADVIIDALPGKFGYYIMKTAIKVKRDLVDVTYMSENPLELDEDAKKNKVLIVPDAGFAPGISNLCVGYAASKLDEVEKVRILVGGIPETNIPPLGYCLTWSAIDLIEEYTRLVRIVRNGEEVKVEPLSGLELIDFEGIGTLEAFYTDGLRTLLYTIKAKDMEEKTLRWPGHAEKIKLLRELGLMSDEVIEIHGIKIIAKEFLAKFLEKKLTCKEIRDLAILRVIVNGFKDNSRITYMFNLIARYDEREKMTAMMKTTGFTASIISQLIANGEIPDKGVVPMELIGMNEKLFHKIISEFSKRGINLRLEVSRIPPGLSL